VGAAARRIAKPQAAEGAAFSKEHRRAMVVDAPILDLRRAIFVSR
jgi:hypothetical protein